MDSVLQMTSEFHSSSTSSARVLRSRKRPHSFTTADPSDTKRRKTHKQPAKLEPNVQISMYGAEMLCRGAFTTRCFRLLFVDDLHSLWVYDRQNVIQTSGLNFVHDTPYFLALLVVLQRFSLAEWGVEPLLVPPSIFTEVDALDRSVNITFSNGVKVVVRHPVQSTLLRGPMLTGKATRILEVPSTSTVSVNADVLCGQSLQNEQPVLKMYWAEASRPPGMDTVQGARKRLAASKLEQGLHRKSCEYLPRYLASDSLSSTDSTIQLFGVNTAPGSKGSRVLRLILSRRLNSLESLDENNFIRAWLQCFNCHYSLWSNEVEHGDINLSNLMWDPVDKCGVLNDFDLAVMSELGQSSGSQSNRGNRTETLPFVARDRLETMYNTLDQTTRLYQHEVESFIWVFVWVCLAKNHADILQTWTFGNIHEAKLQFLRTFQKQNLNPVFPDLAWSKAVLLLNLLNFIDDKNNNNKWIVNPQPFEPRPFHIYIAVTIIIERASFQETDFEKLTWT